MEINETKTEIIEKRKGEKGVTTVEYAVMLVLVAIAVMLANPNISGAVTGVFTQVSGLLAP
jgi:Flp pilus assembly pilin Flp